MKEEGYLPISRKLFEHPFWSEKRVFSYAEAWIDLLRLVRFEANTTQLLVGGKMISIGRGEYPASLRHLADLWGWSKNKVDNFLNLLISEGMITKRTAEGTKQTIVSVCKFDEYNFMAAKPGQSSGQRKDSSGTKKGQRRDNTNNINNTNNENNNTPHTPQGECLNSKARFLFEEHFRKVFSSDYYWTAKDAGAMSQIIQKLTFQRKQKNLEISDETLLYALDYLLSSIKEGWIFENFSVTNINSKFNEIISKARNGNNSSGNQSGEGKPAGIKSISF